MKEKTLFPFGPLMAVGICILIGLVFVAAERYRYRPAPTVCAIPSGAMIRLQLELMSPQTPSQTNEALQWATLSKACASGEKVSK